MKKVIIVDENDSVIDLKPYNQIYFPKEIYRVSRLWVEDSVGNVLLQKRSGSVRFNPNKWAFAVGGTNDEGETYESNIRKEAYEELGLRIENIEFIGKYLDEEIVRRTFCTYFRAVVSKEKPAFDFDKNEVSSIRWFSKKELWEFIKRHETDCALEITKTAPALGLI